MLSFTRAARIMKRWLMVIVELELLSTCSIHCKERSNLRFKKLLWTILARSLLGIREVSLIVQDYSTWNIPIRTRLRAGVLWWVMVIMVAIQGKDLPGMLLSARQNFLKSLLCFYFVWSWFCSVLAALETKAIKEIEYTYHAVCAKTAFVPSTKKLSHLLQVVSWI